MYKRQSYLYTTNQSYENFDLKKIISETCTLTKSETKLVPKTISFSHSFEKKVIITSNPTWVAQILFNLIMNSYQAIISKNEPGTDNKISIKVDYKESSRDFVQISIIDTGHGISKNILNKIMKPYFTTRKAGSGLGLAICKYLSNELGGDLQIKNNILSSGVIATLTLPIKQND